MSEHEYDVGELTERTINEVMEDLIRDGTIDRMSPLDLTMVTMLRTGEVEYVWQVAETGGWQV